MSTKYPQGIITPTPPYKSTTAQSFSGVWTLEQLANNFYYYRQAISKSLRFRSSASAYLNRTPSVAGNRQTWTWSGWVKRGILGSGQQTIFGCSTGGGAPNFEFRFNADALDVYDNSGTVQWRLTTTQVFRDPSSWYHIVFVFDSTNATSSNRAKMYVNGVQVTAFSTATYPSASYSSYWNSTLGAGIGMSVGNYFDGYMAEINFIDGLALDPSYFGQISPITGVWSPAPYVGSYGTNGFYLKFTDTTSTTTLCYDYSGNSNNWTPNNISLTAGSTYDSMLDSPTSYDNGGNGVGNYAVLNPLSLVSPSTLSAGNLNFDTGVSGGGGVYANWQFPLTGKFYFEFSNLSGIAAANGRVLCANSLWESNTGTFYIDGASVATIGGYTDGDTLAFATDCVAQTIAVYKNNTLLYTASAGANLYLSPVAGFRDGSGSNGITGSFNAGQRPFAYTPPTGYKALNTQNLPAPSIQNGANYMAATLYTGNGATQSIVNANNGVSFQPDFIWIKSRSAAYDHRLQNSVVGMQGLLETNNDNTEYTASSGDYPTVTSTGFTLPYGTNGLYYNGSGVTFAAWQWKAGGTAVTNTAGSTNSQVSANTTSGFSVVTYTGTSGVATVGHGIGVAPSMIIVKARSANGTWAIYHAAMGNTKVIYMGGAGYRASETINLWNNTSPTSTVFTVGDGSGGNGTVNWPGVTFVAYCFAAIPGYSAFGSYTGNGSTDGPFVYCGFRPRYVIIKRSDSSGENWVTVDTSRMPYNGITNYLYPNLSNAEDSSTNGINILSNGIKFTLGSGTAYNTSGGTYIYAAFAENPFNYSLAR